MHTWVSKYSLRNPVTVNASMVKEIRLCLPSKVQKGSQFGCSLLDLSELLSEMFGVSTVVMKAHFTVSVNKRS